MEAGRQAAREQIKQSCRTTIIIIIDTKKREIKREKCFHIRAECQQREMGVWVDYRNARVHTQNINKQHTNPLKERIYIEYMLIFAYTTD